MSKTKVKGKYETRVYIGERPDDVPPGWVIYNAPRPILGQMEWSGPCFSGVFYTAVCPTAAVFEQYDARNAELAAVALCYIEQSEALRLTVERLIARDPQKTDMVKNLPPATLLQSFWHMVDKGEIDLSGY